MNGWLYIFVYRPSISRSTPPRAHSPPPPSHTRVHSTGIAEPIAAGGSTDKAGIGLGGDDGYVRPKSRTVGGEEVEDLFEYWRRQKSSAYHAKIDEDKRR